MPFGCHTGCKVADLPDSYLEWGVKNFNGAIKNRFRKALIARGLR